MKAGRSVIRPQLPRASGREEGNASGREAREAVKNEDYIEGVQYWCRAPAVSFLALTFFLYVRHNDSDGA